MEILLGDILKKAGNGNYMRFFVPEKSDCPGNGKILHGFVTIASEL